MADFGDNFGGLISLLTVTLYLDKHSVVLCSGLIRNQ